MAVYVRGDTHGDFYGTHFWCIDNNTSVNDTLVILGDAGINYYENKLDAKLKKDLAKEPITFFCVHGNHEERPANIKSYKKIYSKGFSCFGWIEPEYPNIFFPEDGQAIIENKVCLVLGGAYSIDKEYRLKRGWKWFESEQMSEKEKERIFNFLKKNNSYDYIFSHTAPLKYEPTYLFLPFIDQSKVDKSMEKFLDKVESLITYKEWFFGHYHDDAKINDKVTILNRDTIKL